MKTLKRIFGHKDTHAEFHASISTKTRTELVQMTSTLRRGKGHPGMLRAVEKRLAKMDGFRGA